MTPQVTLTANSIRLTAAVKEMVEKQKARKGSKGKGREGKGNWSAKQRPEGQVGLA
jgi:hypothetical protein